MRLLGRRQLVEILRQFDDERRSVPALASHANSAAMIADHRLNDRKAKSGTMRFTGVIGCEDSFAFLGGKARARVRNFNVSVIVVLSSAQGQRSAVGHCIHGVEYEIRDHAMQKFRIGSDWFNRFRQLKFTFDGWPSGCSKLYLEKVYCILR